MLQSLFNKTKGNNADDDKEKQDEETESDEYQFPI